jgi:predicted DNA-binding mobile mystery protein A
MKTLKQKLLLEQVDKKLAALRGMETSVTPAKGWVHTIRVALKMSLRQLGQRLHVSPQSVREIEQREASGAITLKSLREVANALDMTLVYALVPNGESLESMIGKKANEKAREIVMRTSATMKLEEQQVSYARLEKAISSKTEEIRNKMPKYLWD